LRVTLFLFLSRSFIVLWFLKWGWKAFVLSRCFRVHHDAYLLLLHDISDFTAIFSFVVPRYLCLYRDAHLLLCHDIYEFTAMPSFVAPRYFWFHHDALLLSLHDTFLLARTSFDLQNANTGLSRATSQHVIEIHAAVVASAAGRC
jgi:hypothetical protein